MYDHYLKGAVSALEKAGPLSAMRAFCDLLLRRRAWTSACRLFGKRTIPIKWSLRWNLVTITMAICLRRSIIRGIVRFADAAIDAEPAVIRAALTVLDSYTPKMFRRIAIRTLARAPAEAPDIAEAILTDTALIDADWCREEYGTLAKAWFPRLPAAQQRDILA